jgi:hypothetical protein
MPAMATPGSAGPSSTERALPVAPSPPDVTSDWPKQATDSIVRVVDSVRDKTAGPAVSAARGIVYGSILVVLALPLFILVLVGAMRALERGLIMIGESRNIPWLLQPMWLVYLLFGLLFFLVGLRFWARARKPAPTTP